MLVVAYAQAITQHMALVSTQLEVVSIPVCINEMLLSSQVLMSHHTVLWDDDGISVWFFPRGSIPSDLLAEAPQPTTWGTPMARWPASSCSPSKFFYNHSIIFDTTLCGDWAGGVWSSAGVTGQEQSCAARTGFSTCEDFVRNSGASFSDACEYLFRYDVLRVF